MERTFREYVDEVKRAAHGRWPGVLTAFGVPAAMLVNRHGPCPLCGGTDRFRFDDRHGNGEDYCNGCGAGDGFRLLEKHLGWDFPRAKLSVAPWTSALNPTPSISSCFVNRSLTPSTML